MRNRDIMWLLKIKPALRELELQKQKIREEEKLLSGAGMNMSEMPKAKGAGRGLDAGIAALDALMEQRQELMVEYASLAQGGEVILMRIPMENRTLARMLYVEQLPVWRAANAAHVSESTAKRKKSEMEELEHF